MVRNLYLALLLGISACTNYPFDSLLERDTISQPDTSRDSEVSDSRMRTDMETRDTATLDSFVKKQDATSNDAKIFPDSRNNNLDGGNRFDANYDLSRRPDAGVDAPFDLGLDLDRDFGADVRNDLGNVVGVDRTIINFPDSNYDAPNDAGVDAPFDLGSDVRPDITPIGPCTNVIASYSFDNPSPLEDLCRNHNLINNGSTSTEGYLGQARNFDGVDNYLSTPSTADLNFGTEQNFRMSARIKLTDLPVDYDTVLGKVTGDPRATGYSITYFNGWTCSYWEADRSLQIYSNEALNNGAWHEVKCERINNGTAIRMHIDGIEIETRDITLINANTTVPFTIGNMMHGIVPNRGWFKGQIDDVKIETIPQ